MSRDFKGIWIPKEIWLNEDLTMLEKIIFVEIDSLDNKNHCIAGNEYFAKFCNCSESKISKAIKKLQDLGMIEILAFDGRHRKIRVLCRVVKNAMQDSKKCEAESQNLQANNIDNNIDNKEVLSYDNTTKKSFEFGKHKPKRDPLYVRCVSIIDDFITQHNCINIRSNLIEYLNYRINVKDKPLYANMWKGMLNKLEELHKQGQVYEDIIQFCLERGYLSFYSPNNYNNGGINESGSRNVPRMTSEDYEAEEKRLAELEAKGVQVRF